MLKIMRFTNEQLPSEPRIKHQQGQSLYSIGNGHLLLENFAHTKHTHTNIFWCTGIYDILYAFKNTSSKLYSFSVILVFFNHITCH